MSKREEDLNPAGVPSSAKLSRNLNPLYKLYFKGLVKNDSVTGFGVAICNEKDDLLFQKKGAIFGSDITVLEAELTALKLGLTEAVRLGFNHISIYCDYERVYKLVTRRSKPKKNKLGLLVDDVHRIKDKFVSSLPIFVASNSIKYVHNLAKETLVSEIIIDVDPPHKAKPVRKITCPICLDDEINFDQMFFVEKCFHRFCTECVKRYIEVRLLEGSLMKCLQHRCESKLTFKSCVKVLTPKLREMWEKKIKEDLIPVTDRIYCPNPRCSALMSKTEISSSTSEAGVMRGCSKCSEPFCINCKVTWHDNFSCDDYKMLHPNPTENDEKLNLLAKEKMWRQCGNCQHMIELSHGCFQISCRCGHKFCYHCGGKPGDCRHGYGHFARLQLPENLDQWIHFIMDCCVVCFFLCFVLLIITAAFLFYNQFGMKPFLLFF